MDEQGSVVWQARYDTYGRAHIEVESVGNPLRFQGQYHDVETGLHYNLARYYDPRTGRFIQPDPIGLLGGINHYQYAPNPVMWVDPHGLCAKEEGVNLATNGFGGVPAHLLPKNFDKSMVRPSPEIDPMSQAIKPVNIFPIEWAVQEVADIVGALEDIYSNGITASSAMAVVVAAIPGKVADEVLEPITKKLDNVKVPNNTRSEIISEANVRTAYLKDKYGHLSSQQRVARIDELAGANYERRLTEMLNGQDYVFRYMTESGLQTSMKYGSVRGYTTTNFSHSSSEIMQGAQILEQWPGGPHLGPVRYGAAIPVKKLNGSTLARPNGNSATSGWELFTSSYPEAGKGGFSQFLIDSVPLEDVHLFTLKP